MKKLDVTMNKIVVTGIMSGMRTSAGLLATNILVQQTPGTYFSASPLVSFFYNKTTTKLLTVAAATEVVIDKLPNTPNRTEVGGLVGRAAAGAICGATINSINAKQPLYGAIVGGLTAIASTYAFFYLRKSLCKTTPIPDPVIAIAEDSLAAAFGIALLKK